MALYDHEGTRGLAPLSIIEYPSRNEGLAPCQLLIVNY